MRDYEYEGETFKLDEQPLNLQRRAPPAMRPSWIS